jgi:hypothetical protein
MSMAQYDKAMELWEKLQNLCAVLRGEIQRVVCIVAVSRQYRAEAWR